MWMPKGSVGQRALQAAAPGCLLGALPGEGQPLTQALFPVSLSLLYLFYHRAVSLVSRQVCFGICSRRAVCFPSNRQVGTKVHQ